MCNSPFETAIVVNHNDKRFEQAERIMNEWLGRDTLIALAMVDGYIESNRP